MSRYVKTNEVGGGIVTVEGKQVITGEKSFKCSHNSMGPLSVISDDSELLNSGIGYPIYCDESGSEYKGSYTYNDNPKYPGMLIWNYISRAFLVLRNDGKLIHKHMLPNDYGTADYEVLHAGNLFKYIKDSALK